MHKKLGAWGESVAATHLEAHGYTIVARNWRCPVGEIDLIAQRALASLCRGQNGAAAILKIRLRRANAKLLETAQTYLLETIWTTSIFPLMSSPSPSTAAANCCAATTINAVTAW